MSSRTHLTLILAASLLFFLAPTAAPAQETGTIEGGLTTIDGGPLPGVTVQVVGTAIFVLTDADGSYRLTGVPAGEQGVEASLSGFRRETRTVEVTPGETVELDITLELDVLAMDTIVVTGAVSPYQKIESSVAVTTQTNQEIRRKAPLNTTQLLEVIPGFWAESSGGEGGNNLFARGIPGDGSFRYVAMYEDGLPVYESPELAFTNIDLLLRVDESVESMEGVRGGTASIFASNAPGGLVNFVSKTGGEVPRGLAKFTVGDYNLFRTDFNYGGPLGDTWRYNVGGFYRFDEGIRDPGYPANRGGQVKANVTRLFDNGYARVYGKYMNERNIFYLPVPLQNPGSPTSLPGFDANFDTMTTNDAALVKIPTPDQEILTLNLKDGMHPVYRSVGGELFFDLDNGWSMREAFRALSADVSFNAIFSLDNPFDAVAFAQGRVDSTPGAVGFRYGYTHFSDLAFDPASANGNGLVARTGWWNVEKPLRNYVNDLRFTRELESHAFTAGFYFSEYSADERWIFNNILTEVTGSPRLLDLDLLGADGETLVSVTDNGFESYASLYVNASSDAWVGALYLSDEWQATQDLRLDLGVRFEKANFSGSTEQTSIFDLGDPTTQADDSLQWGNGDFIPYDFDFDELAWSLGANYSVNANLAYYARVSEGFRMPDFEQWVFAPTEKGDTEDVFQLEGGVKYSSPRLGLFASVFFSEFDNVRFEDEIIDPATGDIIRALRFASTETIGLEAELIAQLATDFLLSVTATIQQPEFVDFQFTLGGEDFDFSGNQVRRIPEVLLTVSPTYRVGDFGLYASWQYVDERFVDDANQLVLPDYNVLDAGVTWDLSPSLELQLQGDNLTNEIGLTEGNPRATQIVGVVEDIFMARPILGRSFRLSALYTF